MADAQQILQNLLDKIATEQNYTDPEFKVKQFATEAANFSSYLFEVTISAKGKDCLNLFAKVAAAGEALRSMARMDVFKVESYFYTDLLVRYRKLEEDHNIEEKNRLIVPKFYGIHPTKYEETIVLENLASKGFSMYDRLEPVSWEYASKAFTELAKLHALSFAFAHENPEEYHKAVDGQLKTNRTSDPTQVKLLIESAIQKIFAITKDEYKPHFVQYVSRFTEPEEIMKYILSNKNAMLRHGDFRASNLMHKYEEDGSLTVIPIDFQTIQPGDPVMDLFYLIFTGTDDQFRARHWTQLLDHYFEELQAAMKRLGLNPEETYSKKTFDESVKEMMPFGILVSLTILPMVLVKTCSAPAVGKDTDMSAFMDVQAGTALAERLNGIIGDYIKWGIM